MVNDSPMIDAGVLAHVADLLEGHGVVALPTDTVYGLGACASDLVACDRIFSLKGRPDGLALPVLVCDATQAQSLVKTWDSTSDALARTFWPGALTIVVARAPGVLLGIGGDETTIGLRCPDHGIVRELCRRVGPLAMTSANRHGEAPSTSAAAVREAFGEGIPFVLDGGTCDGRPSTVVALDAKSAYLIRAGAIDFAAVLEALSDAS